MKQAVGDIHRSAVFIGDADYNERTLFIPPGDLINDRARTVPENIRQTAVRHIAPSSVIATVCS